jgi:hypothetical protein
MALHVLVAGLALLHTPGRAEGSVKAAKPVRLRGIRQISASFPGSLSLTDPSKEKRPQAQSYSARELEEIKRPDVRDLEAMFENTETQKHVSVKPRDSPQDIPKKALEAVEEAEELAAMMGSEAPSVNQREAVGPVKEEPKEFYGHNDAPGKSSKTKNSKVKGGSKNPTEAPETVVGEVVEEDETVEFTDEDVQTVEEGTEFEDVPRGGGGDERVAESAPGTAPGVKEEPEGSPPGM